MWPTISSPMYAPNNTWSINISNMTKISGTYKKAHDHCIATCLSLVYAMLYIKIVQLLEDDIYNLLSYNDSDLRFSFCIILNKLEIISNHSD